MGFSKNRKKLASSEFKILEETIKLRMLLEKEWEIQTDHSFEDGQRVQIKTDINFAIQNYKLLRAHINKVFLNNSGERHLEGIFTDLLRYC